MQLTLPEFVQVAEARELVPSQREVLFAIRNLGGRATAKEVSKYLGKQLNRISGRFSELERKECILKCGKKYGFTEYELLAVPEEG